MFKLSNFDVTIGTYRRPFNTVEVILTTYHSSRFEVACLMNGTLTVSSLTSHHSPSLPVLCFTFAGIVLLVTD